MGIITILLSRYILLLVLLLSIPFGLFYKFFYRQSCDKVNVSDKITFKRHNFTQYYMKDDKKCMNGGFSRCIHVRDDLHDEIKLIQSQLTMRDGVKIAIFVYMQESIFHDDDNGIYKAPTIVHGTRYYSMFKIKYPFTYFLGNSMNPRFHRLIEPFVRNGYVYVMFDVRGTGDSGGYRQFDLSFEEREDFKEILHWITLQKWYNGNVGSTGESYEGMVSEAMLALDGKMEYDAGESESDNQVKAIAPLFSPLDFYRDVSHPGGLLSTTFLSNYENFVSKLELFEEMTEDAMNLLPFRIFMNYFADRFNFTDDIIATRQKNWKISSKIKEFEFADDIVDLLQNKTIDHLTFNLLKNNTRRRDIGLYTLSSWYDGSFISSTIKRFHLYQTPYKKLIIGPWNHGGVDNVSPCAETRRVCFEFASELIRFFDIHLKKDKLHGISQDQIMKQYYDDEDPVHYFTLVEEKWHSSKTWPPSSSKESKYYLGSNFELSEHLNSRDDEYTIHHVNFNTGSGVMSRWNLLRQLEPGSLRYESLFENIKMMHSFRTKPVQSNVVITGNPKLLLQVKTNQQDAVFFAYLLDFDPETGSYVYVTEGHLRAIHRKLREDFNEEAGQILTGGRTYYKEDTTPMDTNACEEVVISMQPISYMVKRGHIIQLSISGWDKDNFHNEEIMGLMSTEFHVFVNSTLLLPLSSG